MGLSHDVKTPAAQTFDPQDGLARFIELAQRPARRSHQGLTGGGQLRAVLHALKQLRAELALKRLDRLTERWLRHMHGRGCMPEAAVVRHGKEVLEGASIHLWPAPRQGR